MGPLFQKECFISTTMYAEAEIKMFIFSHSHVYIQLGCYGFTLSKQFNSYYKSQI